MPSWNILKGSLKYAYFFGCRCDLIVRNYLSLKFEHRGEIFQIFKKVGSELYQIVL